MLNNYTPGPWNLSFESVDSEWAVITTTGGAVIANVNANGYQEANAQLIAAAPDLLEALKELVSLLKEQYVKGNDLLWSEFDDAESAINKAEGK